VDKIDQTILTSIVEVLQSLIQNVFKSLGGDPALFFSDYDETADLCVARKSTSSRLDFIS